MSQPLTVALTLFVSLVFLAAPAQGQSGRLLATQPGNAIVECNSDASNCFTVVSTSARPTSASLATDGTIAFDALDSIDGTCVPGGQGICRSHVFLMDADGRNVRQITFNPAAADNFGGDNSAAISPDGTTVAFLSNRNPAFDSNNNPSYLYQIYLVDSNGSNLRQLTLPVYGVPGSPQAGTPFGEVFSVAWSPDSTKVTFKGSTYGATPCGTFFGFPKQCRVVGSINADGTGLTYFTVYELDADSTVFAIDWSPDGTLIAYGRSPSLGDPAIAIIDLSGQGRYAAGITAGQLVNACALPQCIHFSPDNDRLAYGNGSAISTITLDGTNRTDTGVGFGGGISGASPPSLWWTAATIPIPAQLSLEPDPVEVWPGFRQQLTPSLLDGSSNLILHAAGSYDILPGSNPNCGIQIGPYGLTMFSSGNGNDGGSIVGHNAGLTSNSVLYKCWASPPCTYTLIPTSVDSPAAGGPDEVFVDTDPGPNNSACPYHATSNSPWIVITSGPDGRGDSTVSFIVAPNTGPARDGTMIIAGQTFTVHQAEPGTPSADLSITKTDSPDPVTVGSNLTYTITVTNTGPDGATNVTMSDSLPAELTFVSATANQGSCTGTSTVTCTLGSLANGASAIVTIVVTPTESGSVSNTATVSGAEGDPSLANNAATAMTTVNPLPPTLSALSPAKLWVGQNDAIKQLKFDLMAEVLVNGSVVGSGKLANVGAGGSKFGQATLDKIALTLNSATAVPPGTALSIRVKVRASCSAKKTGISGAARLWFNGQLVDAGSRFDATIGGTNAKYFLRSGFALATIPGASREFIDVAVSDATPCPGRPFAPFGTWTITFP